MKIVFLFSFQSAWRIYWVAELCFFSQIPPPKKNDWLYSVFQTSAEIARFKHVYQLNLFFTVLLCTPMPAQLVAGLAVTA